LNSIFIECLICLINLEIWSKVLINLIKILFLVYLWLRLNTRFLIWFITIILFLISIYNFLFFFLWHRIWFRVSLWTLRWHMKLLDLYWRNELNIFIIFRSINIFIKESFFMTFMLLITNLAAHNLTFIASIYDFLIMMNWTIRFLSTSILLTFWLMVMDILCYINWCLFLI